MVLRPCEDVGHLFERRAERRALSGRVLQNDHRLSAASRGEQLEQAVGDEIEAGGFAARGVAARMKDDALQTERFGAVDLVSPWPRAIGAAAADAVVARLIR